MDYRSFAVFVCLAACLAAPVRGQDGATVKLLEPRKLTLQTDGIPLSRALAELSAKTGNQVVDRRGVKTDPKLKLNLTNSAFWPALDALAKAAGCGVSTYQTDGQVALIDTPTRNLATSYQGIFRSVAKRIYLIRDDDAGAHDCILSLDVAWEPRFEPLYFDIGAVQATFAADSHGVKLKAQAPPEGKVNVAGRNALEFDVRLPAPHRSSPAIKKLEGTFQLIGPGKMLAFAFPKLMVSGTARSQSQDGVKVTVSPLKAATRRWSVAVAIDNPPGNPSLESYQSWLGNNGVFLEKGSGVDRKVWRPAPGDELIEKESTDQARILYSFRVSPTDPPGSPADWTLHYRTPGKIVAIDVPYNFKDLPLP